MLRKSWKLPSCSQPPGCLLRCLLRGGGASKAHSSPADVIKPISHVRKRKVKEISGLAPGQDPGFHASWRHNQVPTCQGTRGAMTLSASWQLGVQAAACMERGGGTATRPPPSCTVPLHPAARMLRNPVGGPMSQCQPHPVGPQAGSFRSGAAPPRLDEELQRSRPGPGLTLGSC